MQDYRPGRFQILPPVVKNLLIINGLFYLATIVVGSTFGIDLSKSLGLFYVGADNFKPHQLLTHLFMHGSMMHIFSNMFALWMFGSVLENVWGTKRFLIYYFVTGLGAAVIHSLVTALDIMSLQAAVETYSNTPSLDTFKVFVDKYIAGGYYASAFNELIQSWTVHPTDEYFTKKSIEYAWDFLNIKENIPTVGASGAVFGVLLAFGMLFPNTLIYLYFFFPIKAKYFVIFYGLFELYSGIKYSAGDNVAHFAHLGGMLFGFFLIKYWNRKRRSDFF